MLRVHPSQYDSGIHKTVNMQTCISPHACVQQTCVDMIHVSRYLLATFTFTYRSGYNPTVHSPAFVLQMVCGETPCIFTWELPADLSASCSDPGVSKTSAVGLAELRCIQYCGCTEISNSEVLVTREQIFTSRRWFVEVCALKSFKNALRPDYRIRTLLRRYQHTLSKPKIVFTLSMVEMRADFIHLRKAFPAR